jgi:hypothetical protein
MKQQHDLNAAKIRKWIQGNPQTNRQKLREFLDRKGHASHGIAHALFGPDWRDIRKKIVICFKIK